MEFAAAIFRDETPTAARKSAYNKCKRRGNDNAEDTTLRRRLKKFFGVPRFDDTNAGWKKILVSWFASHPEYIERLRLPENEPFMNMLLRLFPDKAIEIKSKSGWGRIERAPSGGNFAEIAPRGLTGPRILYALVFIRIRRKSRGPDSLHNSGILRGRENEPLDLVWGVGARRRAGISSAAARRS